MRIFDLNVLLYAVNQDDPRHTVARECWESAFNSDDPVGLAWITLIGYLRLATHPSVFAAPQSIDQALEQVNAWRRHANTRVIAPTNEHWNILSDLLKTNAGGNLTTDAHLAALAIERGAVLVSFDSDFSRFAQLRWENPGAGSR